MFDVPFNKPYLADRGLRYIAQAVSHGSIASDGPFTRRCAELLEQCCGALRVLMTPSCTAALEMAGMLCDLGEGDEVILPSFTFISTASAVCRAGARPVFVDIRPDTLNLDESLVEKAVTRRTKAIFPVHYAGVGCEMDAIMEIARRHELLVVEDAALGCGASYRGRPLGTLGHLGTYSFHATKNFACGEGGALLINAPELVERAEILRDNGTNRRQFLRGQVDKYTWVDLGSSYAPSEIVCAFLLGQLELRDGIADRLRRLQQAYCEGLAECDQAGWLRLPHVPAHCQSNGHMFYVVLPDHGTRNRLIDQLAWRGVQATFHYVPLHNSPMGRRHGWAAGSLPVTENLSGRLLRLPLYCEMTDADQELVIDCVRNFFTSGSRRAA